MFDDTTEAGPSTTTEPGAARKGSIESVLQTSPVDNKPTRKGLTRKSKKQDTNIATLKRKALPKDADPTLVEPATKRRGSIEMARLSLQDRDSGSALTWLARGSSPNLDLTSKFSEMDHITGQPHAFDPAAHHAMQMVQNPAFGGPVPGNGGAPSSAGPTRSLRSRSTPRGSRGDQAINDQTSPQLMSQDDASSSGTKDGGDRQTSQTPYSRSPELRVSHKLAERKRRKEMKDLFDELRDQLPQDRGMKASKWEILSKAIDFINNMKQAHGEMSREIEMLRHEVEGFRQGLPPAFHNGPPPQVVFGQHVIPPFPPGGPVPPHQSAPSQPDSRPASSQNSFPPGDGPNGNAGSRTGTPSS